MPLIRYIESNGNEYEAEVPVGNTVMQGAIDNMIDGILAECGGVCSCATCHCYVDDNWNGKTGQPSALEKELLSAVNSPQPNSRLSCQITVTEDLNGLVIHLPESQY